MVFAFRLEPTAVNDYVRIGKEGGERLVASSNEVVYLDTFNTVSRTIRAPDVNEPELVALSERGEKLARYVPCGARKQDSHAIYSSLCCSVRVKRSWSAPGSASSSSS